MTFLGQLFNAGVRGDLVIVIPSLGKQMQVPSRRTKGKNLPVNITRQKCRRWSVEAVPELINRGRVWRRTRNGRVLGIGAIQADAQIIGALLPPNRVSRLSKRPDRRILRFSLRDSQDVVATVDHALHCVAACRLGA